MAGKGVRARLDGVTYTAGRPEWAEEQQLTFPPQLREALEEAETRGESVIGVMDAQAVVAVIGLADQMRPGARATIAALKAEGIEPVMITGDAEAVAATVARELGISRRYARVLPADKAAKVKELQRSAATAFVGDGINDAPALLQADLGVAIGAGTNIAIESADLVLVDDDPADVLAALRLSRATYRKMTQNIAWAAGYNALAMPLAAGVLAGIGFVLSPAVGAILMSASTVIVAVNAMTLRRTELRPGAAPEAVPSGV